MPHPDPLGIIVRGGAKPLARLDRVNLYRWIEIGWLNYTDGRIPILYL